MRVLFCFVIACLAPGSSLFALNRLDVTPQASELLAAGCRPSSKRIAASPGTTVMFRYDFKEPVPAFRSKYAVTAVCKEGSATAYYFKYANHKQARRAFIFARLKIWNGYSRSAEKPERIYLFNNFLVVVSSPEAPHTLDQLLVKKVSTAPVDDETIRKIMKRLKCGEGSAFYETCRALRLYRGSVAVNFRVRGFRFGRVREFGPRGGTRVLYQVAYISEGGSPPAGFITPVNPENEAEARELKTLHENLKAGRPSETSPAFKEFLEQSRAKMSRPVRSFSTFHLLESIRINFHVRNVRGKFIVISTTEHMTGIPSGLIVGVLRPIR